MKFIKTLKNTTNPNKKRKILIADMIAHMISNKEFNPVVTELFIR